MVTSDYFLSQIGKIKEDLKEKGVVPSEKNLISMTFSFPAVLRQRKCKSVTRQAVND
jgi:hypothetical protein